VVRCNGLFWTSGCAAPSARTAPLTEAEMQRLEAIGAAVAGERAGTEYRRHGVEGQTGSWAPAQPLPSSFMFHCETFPTFAPCGRVNATQMRSQAPISCRYMRMDT
jgi:hypothetical protein